MSEFLAVSCPYCGAESDLFIDEDGGSRQSYVQDCPVCCQPWQVEITRDRDADWSAAVRTIDE
ncbi:MAG TPA: CPXCG motif-containing cysteine-rich protein [Thermoanaerobaculia bacterium]|nr:CPXCG motif-containing cysteine-rich protein [Thermoanaerobaculia bacterium]